MIVAIGSTRPAKVQAVKDAFEAVRAYFLRPGEAFGFETYRIPSHVADMPTTLPELMAGARNRAKNLQKIREKADFYVGLEGGFFQQRPQQNDPVQTFLQGWAFVTNGRSESFGASYCAPVPAALVKAVYEDHLELGVIIDRFSGAKNVRDHRGAFGIFTLDILTRSHSFKTALWGALAPFYNPSLYQKPLD